MPAENALVAYREQLFDCSERLPKHECQEILTPGILKNWNKRDRYLLERYGLENEGDSLITKSSVFFIKNYNF